MKNIDFKIIQPVCVCVCPWMCRRYEAECKNVRSYAHNKTNLSFVHSDVNVNPLTYHVQESSTYMIGFSA